MELDIRIFDLLTKEYSYETITYQENDTLSIMFHNAFGSANYMPVDKTTGENLCLVDYYFDDNGRIFWDSFIGDVKVKYLLKRYPDLTERFDFYTNFGGLGAAGTPVDFALELWEQINQYLSTHPLACSALGFIVGKAVDKLKEVILNNFSKIKCKNIASFNNSINSREEWTVKELKEATGIDDLNALIPPLMSLNFEFDDKSYTFHKKKN